MVEIVCVLAVPAAPSSRLNSRSRLSRHPTARTFPSGEAVTARVAVAPISNAGSVRPSPRSQRTPPSPPTANLSLPASTPPATQETALTVPPLTSNPSVRANPANQDVAGLLVHLPAPWCLLSMRNLCRHNLVGFYTLRALHSRNDRGTPGSGTYRPPVRTPAHLLHPATHQSGRLLPFARRHRPRHGHTEAPVTTNNFSETPLDIELWWGLPLCAHASGAPFAALQMCTLPQSSPSASKRSLQRRSAGEIEAASTIVPPGASRFQMKSSGPNTSTTPIRAPSASITTKPPAVCGSTPSPHTASHRRFRTHIGGEVSLAAPSTVSEGRTS